MLPVKTELHATGFTLLELLIALALLSFLSTLTYQAVSGILVAEKQVKESSRRWQDLASLFDQLEQDALQAVARPIRDARGTLRPEWVLSPANSQGELAMIEWTRLGGSILNATNDGNDGSDSRRIGYRLNAGRLEYLQWAVLDQAPSSIATATLVAENIQGVRWRCLSQDRRWLEIWPIPGMAESLPRAVEIIITLDDGSNVSRRFAIGP